MKKIFLLFILPIMCFTLLIGVNTFAKSNIDFTNENDIEDYKYSNVIFSTINLQFENDNYIVFEFYDKNDVGRFVVELNFPYQNVTNVFLDGEFTFDLFNHSGNFNFIEFLISNIQNLSTDYDYISIIENGYFRIVNYDDEIYYLIVDSDLVNVDFIIYNQSKGILSTIIGTINSLGLGILNFIKNGFVSFFFVDGTVSNIGIFTFCMLGISLVIGLTCWITSLVRKKR